MSTINYLDGSSLTSTALTSDQIQTAFQIITAQMLGIVIFPVEMTLANGTSLATPLSLANLAVGQSLTGTGIPGGTTISAIGSTTITMNNNATADGDQSIVVAAPDAYSQVRVGWQQEGQPGWFINQTYTILRCSTSDSEYSRMRDVTGAASGDTITQTDVYTRQWKTYWTFLGPNALDNARAVRSALITIQFVADYLAQSNLYVDPSIDEPMRSPEEFQGQWWERTDLVARFNEQITETFTVGLVQSVDVSIYDKDGLIAEFTTEV